LNSDIPPAKAPSSENKFILKPFAP
jgi:hypothetical protein